jgi:peptide/nickel transport system substrate-binding protein
MTPRFGVTLSDGTLRWDPSWLTHEPLVILDPTGPGMSVTYTLNPKAHWSDGAQVTVRDFEYTWKSCLDDPGPVCTNRGFEYVIDIRQGTTPQEILVFYATEYSPWQYTFARGPLRTGTGRERWDSLTGHEASFSGPFTVAFSEGTAITLTRNPLWWAVKPKLDLISFTLVPDKDLPLAFLRSQIDAVWVDDPNLYSRLEDLPGISVRRSLSPLGRYLLMNCTHGPLADRKVRQAVFLGLDLKGLAASDLAGWKWTPHPLTSTVWPPGLTEYSETDSPMPRHDPSKAKDLLEEQGWVLKPDGVRRKDGQELAWAFLIPDHDPLSENEAFAIRAQLKNLGIRVDLIYLSSDDRDTQISSTSAMTAETLEYTTVHASVSRFITGNPWQYHNPSIDSLYQEMITTADRESLKDLVTQVDSILWEDISMIPAYQVPHVLMVRPDLANYGPNELGDTLWESVGWES